MKSTTIKPTHAPTLPFSSPANPHLPLHPHKHPHGKPETSLEKRYPATTPHIRFRSPSVLSTGQPLTAITTSPPLALEHPVEHLDSRRSGCFVTRVRSPSSRVCSERGREKTDNSLEIGIDNYSLYLSLYLPSSIIRRRGGNRKKRIPRPRV